HARAAVGQGGAVEDDRASGVPGNDEFVGGVAAVVGRLAVDEARVGELQVGAAVPGTFHHAAILVAVGAVHREVRAVAGLDAVLILVRAEMARQEVGGIGGVGEVIVLMYGREPVAGDTGNEAFEVELSGVEGQRVAI